MSIVIANNKFHPGLMQKPRSFMARVVNAWWSSWRERSNWFFYSGLSW